MNELLSSSLQSQISDHLARILARGAGRLEIRIEKCRVAWLYPYSRIYNPLALAPAVIATRPLAELLGEWGPCFKTELARVVGHQFGAVQIGIDRGRIQYIDGVLDVRAQRPTDQAPAFPGG